MDCLSEEELFCGKEKRWLRKPTVMEQLWNNPSTGKIPVMGDMNFSNPDNLEIIGEVKSPIYTIENYISEDFSKHCGIMLT